MRSLNRAFGSLLVLAAVCGAQGCVSSRDSRNGVFNENQYLRKSFLITNGDGKTPDEGWFVKSTITSTSTPNPLGNIDGAGLFAGSEGSTLGNYAANYVRFDVTQDKLNVINLREISNDPTYLSQNTRQPEIVNAWPVTNVDIKYRIDLDGEKTNFLEENQEADWRVRQWVKLNFAKNDLSDLYAFGANSNPVIQKCVNLTDASVSLVPNTFNVDEANGYFEYSLNLTAPIQATADDAATCLTAFGGITTMTWEQLQRQNVSLTMKTAYVRPSKMTDGSYVPLIVDEKDPIRHKYGAIDMVLPYRDTDSGLLGAKQAVNRFNPNKDIVFYFAAGMPDVYRTFFTGPGGVVEKTNDILTKAGAKGRLKMFNYNDKDTYLDGKGPDRQYGDPRYSFIVWHSDLDTSVGGLLGVEQQFADPRTGETISSSVNVYDYAFKDTVQQRLDLFLQTVGEEYLLPNGEFDDSKYPASCTDGDTVPLVQGDVAAKLNQASTVYGKMQGYLQKPFANYGYLGPKDFIPTHDPVADKDFWDAYFAVLPYEIYADPAASSFVIPDGTIDDSAMAAGAAKWTALQQRTQFHKLAGDIDKGLAPYDTEGPSAISGAVAFHDNLSTLTQSVSAYDHTSHYSGIQRTADDFGLFSYMDVYQKNGRHCVGNPGKWESRTDYTNRLITSLNFITAAHEFGHALGLDHNFMGSIDQRNFPLGADGKPTFYSSSIMEYNNPISEAFFESNAGTPVWAPYDIAALGWIYGNNLDAATAGPKPTTQASTTVSGQVSATAPWNDPLGFNGATETNFLFCTNKHTLYTPLCQQHDLGVTPAQITANDIQQREWNYLWTNFRLYHKYASYENYSDRVATDFQAMRRFQSQWTFDWSGGELTNTLRLAGTQVPQGSTAADYYKQLTAKFNTDISMANQLVATYHRAIIEQSSGERPFITVYDPYFGDVTQQGIQLDKVVATDSFSQIWPAISNFDPSQAGGFYITSVGGQFGDPAYTTVSSQVLADFLGASFATYKYAQLGPIANFAAATHSTLWGGDIKFQTWVGGWAFERERDFLDFVHSMAVKYQFQNCDENGQNCQPCTSLDSCTWDPRQLQAKNSDVNHSDRYNRFQTPDGRTYIWGYLKSRNQWVLADKDLNVATYAIMLNWTTDLVNGEDDGENGSANLEYNVRYIVDAFQYYDGNTLYAP